MHSIIIIYTSRPKERPRSVSKEATKDRDVSKRTPRLLDPLTVENGHGKLCLFDVPTKVMVATVSLEAVASCSPLVVEVT